MPRHVLGFGHFPVSVSLGATNEAARVHPLPRRRGIGAASASPSSPRSWRRRKRRLGDLVPARHPVHVAAACGKKGRRRFALFSRVRFGQGPVCVRSLATRSPESRE